MGRIIKFWGIKIEEEYDGNELFWNLIDLKKPLYWNGWWSVGLNEKFLREAKKRGIRKIRVPVLDSWIYLPDIPVEKLIKQKEKEGAITLKQSKFNPNQQLKILLFKVRPYEKRDKMACLKNN